MSAKRSSLRLSSLLVVATLCAMAAIPTMAEAQSTTAKPAATEMDAILFVQTPHPDIGKGAIHLVWIPQPLQRVCLGKTAQQCADIDYCVRTTNRNVSMCKNLGIPLSHLPSYPPNMVPRRQLSVVLMRLTPDHFTMLQDFYRKAPRASLEHLSLSARVKARVRFTRKADDDDFDVLEILAVAPF